MGDRVFVGAGAIILPGVTIGNDSIIGAGSVVNEDVAPETVVAGSPARPVCSLADYLEKHRLAMESAPCFDSSYTLDEQILPAMKDEMNERMTKDIGYVT